MDNLETPSAEETYREIYTSDLLGTTDSAVSFVKTFHTSDNIAFCSNRVSQREFLYNIEIACSCTYDVSNNELSQIVQSYFPEYFYPQKPYKDLIDVLASRTGFNYAIADSIPTVYDIDRLSPDRRNYNAMLRLLGINYDFNDYPIKMLKVLLKNYMSIRKHRGTKASILAMLRSMDEKFLDDPSNPCELELEFIRDCPVSSNITIDKLGVLQITYENILPNFYRHVYYMLGKVIPTGIYYSLIHRKLHLVDNMASLIDRGYAEDTLIYLKRLKELISFGDSVSYRELELLEYASLLDRRNSNQEDQAVFSEKAVIWIRVKDEIMTDEAVSGREVRVIDHYIMTANNSINHFVSEGIDTDSHLPTIEEIPVETTPEENLPE